MNLTRLLKPQSIAVVGGGAWGHAIIEQSQRLGFSGALYVVHPKAPEVAGLPTYRNVADLPDAPDACFIGINRTATIETVRQLREMGAGGAVCFASGFAEANAELEGAKDLQAELLEAAGDMPILGPNCYGFLNLVDKAALWPDQHGAVPCASGVAILTQSSNIAINLTMQTRGLPVAYVITVGNQAQIDLATAAMAVLEDNRVTALGLHIEGFSNLSEFHRLAKRARDLGKPIIALKVGVSSEAQAATVSHTASLAGSDAGASALMHRFGMIRVNTLAEFLETLKIAHLFGALPNTEVASASCSGGEASLIADLGQMARLTFPALTPEQKSRLGKVLGPAVALANPLDYHTYIWGDVEKIDSMIDALAADHLALTIIVLDFPHPDRCSDKGWDVVVEAAHRVATRRGVRIAILASLPDTMPEAWASRCLELGLLPLSGMAEGLAAIRYAAELSKMRVADELPILSFGEFQEEAICLVSEADAKAELTSYGVCVPTGQMVTEQEALSQIDVPYPWVMKATGLAHKSDSGGVVLGLHNLETAQAAYQAMPSQHVWVEAMIAKPIAELLIGVTRDPAHGFVMTIGAGGILTELIRDTASVLIPFEHNDLMDALRGLTVYRLLTGYRNTTQANLEAVKEAIFAVQSYVLSQHRNLIELEINPLIVTSDQAVAADALIRRAPNI